MKYIDAEKLKAEIERHIPQEQGFGDGGEEYGYKCALKDIKRFIAFLQQEQPESNIPSAGSGAMGTIPPKFKLEVKEQPVEELKELRKEVIKFNQDHFDELHSDMETIDIVHIIARHFAEWGRKQVLQEIYEGKVKPVDKITAAWLDDK